MPRYFASILIALATLLYSTGAGLSLHHAAYHSGVELLDHAHAASASVDEPDDRHRDDAPDAPENPTPHDHDCATCQMLFGAVVLLGVGTAIVAAAPARVCTLIGRVDAPWTIVVTTRGPRAPPHSPSETAAFAALAAPFSAFHWGCVALRGQLSKELSQDR